MRTIVDDRRVDDALWDKIIFLWPQNAKKDLRKHFEKTEKLTLAEYYKLILGIQVSRRDSKYVYKFKKLP